MKKVLFYLFVICLVSCGKDASIAIGKSAAFMVNAQEIIVDECNNISKVWGDAIHYDGCYVEKSGYEVINSRNWNYLNTKDLSDFTYCSNFNEALRVYDRSSRHAWMMGMANEQMDSCRFYLAQMSSPKKKQKEICEQAKRAFRALQSVYDCADSPSGSYQSYNSDTRSKNNRFMEEFRILEDMMRYAE